MVLLQELFHMLRSRATGPSFIEATTRHQGHDGEHFGAGTEFHDGEQIGQIIPKNVARDGDRIQATNGTLE